MTKELLSELVSAINESGLNINVKGESILSNISVEIIGVLLGALVTLMLFSIQEKRRISADLKLKFFYSYFDIFKNVNERMKKTKNLVDKIVYTYNYQKVNNNIEERNSFETISLEGLRKDIIQSYKSSYLLLCEVKDLSEFMRFNSSITMNSEVFDEIIIDIKKLLDILLCLKNFIDNEIYGINRSISIFEMFPLNTYGEEDRLSYRKRLDGLVILKEIHDCELGINKSKKYKAMNEIYEEFIIHHKKIEKECLGRFFNIKKHKNHKNYEYRIREISEKRQDNDNYTMVYEYFKEILNE